MAKKEVMVSVKVTYPEDLALEYVQELIQNMLDIGQYDAECTLEELDPEDLDHIKAKDVVRLTADVPPDYPGVLLWQYSDDKEPYLIPWPPANIKELLKERSAAEREYYDKDGTGDFPSPLQWLRDRGIHVMILDHVHG